MKLSELVNLKKVELQQDGKYKCLLCNNKFSRLGITKHYFYTHTEDGKNRKNNISSKLTGKTKKELSTIQKNKIIELKRNENKIIPSKTFLSRDEIKKFLNEKYGDNDLSNVGRWIKKKYENIYNSIIINTSYLDTNCTFSERVYHIVNDIYGPILCKKCDKRTSFRTFYFGYYAYCSSKCMANDDDITQKKRNTCLEKYGVTHQSKTKEFKNKTIDTNMEKFGVEYPAQSEKIIEKTKDIFISKYGVDNPMKSEEIKNVLKRNNISKYGVENPSSLPEVIEKRKTTFYKNFGADHFMKVDSEPKKRIISLQKEKFFEIMDRILLKLNLSIDEEYQHAHYRHLWKCTKCETEFYQSWNMIQQGFKCPTCYPRNNGTSLQEKEVYEFIKQLIPNEEIITNSRQIINPKELDIYIPSKNIAIEYNGLYWHSHEVLEDEFYHIEKLIACEKIGIRLIQIFEDEWLLKQDIVKERLKNILCINDKIRIHGRKCIIKEITPRDKNDFLEKFHIQGKDNSTIKLGAFYNNELVSVMTFSKGNIAKGSKAISDIWELNRFCSDYNYHIPGIASKLLTFFKRNYIWKEIYSYADMRWSDGNLYSKLGFNLISKTKPNYWYLKDFQRIHRFNLRKRPDEPKNIPEWVLRYNEGYSKIFDCGNYKFELKNYKNNGTKI